MVEVSTIQLRLPGQLRWTQCPTWFVPLHFLLQTVASKVYALAYRFSYMLYLFWTFKLEEAHKQSRKKMSFYTELIQDHHVPRLVEINYENRLKSQITYNNETHF